MTPVATSLLHRFRAAFADLADLRDDEGRARIHEALAAHVRSIAPMATPPAPDPAALISRDLKDGSTYRLFVADACVVLTLSHPDAALEPVEVVRLRADLDSVASSVGAARG